jgi:hypothetical protein
MGASRLQARVESLVEAAEAVKAALRAPLRGGPCGPSGGFAALRVTAPA